jgi:hypothetical protein
MTPRLAKTGTLLAAAIVLASMWAGPTDARAETIAGGTPAAASETEEQDEAGDEPATEGEKKKKGGWVGIPIPISNPTIGSGLGAVGLYNLRLGREKHPDVLPSSFGAGAFYTDSDSWGFGILARTHVGGGLFRINGVGAVFELNYDFFGIGEDAGDRGRSVPISQTGDFFRVSFLTRLRGHWYLGPRFLRLDARTEIDFSGILPPDLDIPTSFGLDLTTAALGLALQLDSRDNQFNGSEGVLFDLETDFYDEAFSSDFDFETYWGAFNKYLSLGENDHTIVAVRGTACYASDGAPFYELCQVGIKDSFRGYQGGRYRDQVAVTAQAAYRWRFHKRWGVVFFGGIASVAERFSDLDSLLPAAGVGVRWMAVTEDRINVRVDYAWGRNDSALYISIAEAF